MKTIAFVKHRDIDGIRIYKKALALKHIGNYKLILISKVDDKRLLNKVLDKIIDLRTSQEKKITEKLKSKKSYLKKTKLFNLFYKKFLKKRFLKQEANKLAKIIKKINIDIDLFHTITGDDRTAQTVMQNTDKPVVFDGVDFTGISRGIDDLKQDEKKTERYCLENANGIIRKGPKYEIDYYRNLGYKINCPELHWLDYCDKEFFASKNIKKMSSEDKEIHLVYCGNVSTNIQKPQGYYVALGKILAKQKIHLHIYPSQDQWQKYELGKYVNLSKKEKYFHLHQALPYNQLTKEIAKFDWGIWIHPNTYEKNQPTDKILRKAKRKVSIGNKLFTYLEAGLPTIVSNHLIYGKKIVKKYNIGFSIRDEDLKNMKSLLNNYDYFKMKKSVLSARKKLSIKKNAHRLDDFYKSLMP
jgi:hypothetical protein